MAHRPIFSTLALVTLTVLPLGTIGCSQGQSPTEPAFSDTDSATSTSSMSSVAAESRGRGGADDTQADDNGGNNGGNHKGGGTKPAQPRAGQQFTGAVTAVGNGTLTLAGGTKVSVNAQTQWNARGDLFSLSQVSTSLATGHAPRVEGRGTRQSNGTILAQSIKAEDNR